MKRILVATDISNNSSAAVRFALQLALQWPVAITFLNVHNVTRPVGEIQRQLEQFVEEVRQQLAVTIADYSCVVINAFSVTETIMHYARKHRFDYICIGARGAGTIEKLIGTTTATLINQSTVPVIAVPASYQVAPIQHLLYASDLTNLEAELKQVVDVAQPLGATVDLVHVMGPAKPEFDLDDLQTTVRQISALKISVYIEAAIVEQNLAANLEQIIQRVQPSLLIMFTTQRSGFVRRLLFPSQCAGYTFIGSVPVLVFTKA
ncbi:hypothetical protein BN8_01605 [Fibrisoma limi BUZ 3]|uniref:UspA domain-containing protein n=1 Tax=Fibrisoma limi BUZ 3 TaxID=1185876 RepID=I2GFB8_9BACT|nr:universal stress protein [Fibrisoma limi]CCH52593.1 hypothetical protein BN8_01605 [Fibrisoma limi BUZ 3]